MLMLLEMLISFALFGTEHQYFSIYSRYLSRYERTNNPAGINFHDVSPLTQALEFERTN